LTQINYPRQAAGTVTKKEVYKMFSSIWCIPLYAGTAGGHVIPLPGCDRKPLAEG
jgi:hypothetical protein